MGTDNKLSNGTNIGKALYDNTVSNIDGIFSSKPMGKYLTGARCVLKVDKKIVGFAFAISWDIKLNATEINTIDDYMPYELAPQRIEVNGAISGFRIPGSSPTQLLIQADILNFLHQRYVEIEVRDSQTDNLIFYTNKALITGRQENIKSDSISDMTLSFKAIGFADERTPNYAKGIGEPIGDGTNPITRLSDKAKAAYKSVKDLF